MIFNTVEPFKKKKNVFPLLYILYKTLFFTDCLYIYAITFTLSIGEQLSLYIFNREKTHLYFGLCFHIPLMWRNGRNACLFYFTVKYLKSYEVFQMWILSLNCDTFSEKFIFVFKIYVHTIKKYFLLQLERF